MGLRFRQRLPWAFICLLFLLPAVAFAVSVPPQPDQYVVDLAAVVDPSTTGRLNGYLKELEQKTGAQVVVLTIKSLEGEALEAFSIRIAHDRWKLGQRGKDNGVLLLVAVGDRKYRIEVGYGLEGVLPDSLVGSIGRDLMVPYLKRGDYPSGIAAAVLAIANEIAIKAGVTISGMPDYQRIVKVSKPPGLFRTVVSVLFFIMLLLFFLRNPRAFFLFFLLSGAGGGRGWGSGHGGFGGGGFGGFGGGGGGGFGGGGASGGW